MCAITIPISSLYRQNCFETHKALYPVKPPNKRSTYTGPESSTVPMPHMPSRTLFHRRTQSASSTSSTRSTDSTTPTPSDWPSTTSTSTKSSSTSSSTTSSISKPPSVLRYTYILLKARPSPSDIEILSVYNLSRSVPAASRVGLPITSGTSWTRIPTTTITETGTGTCYWDERSSTPPPPYSP